MKLPGILDQLYAQFMERADQGNLILLHPESHLRSSFIARLTNSTDYEVFYYALSPDDIDLSAFLNGMAHDLQDQNPLFGRYLHLLSANDLAKKEKLLEAGIRDIIELSDKPFLLILDEYDRSHSADDIQWFMEKLIHRMPAHSKVVINSRILPRIPWVPMIARKRAILFNDNQIIRENFYNFAGGDHLLEVYALGPGFVLFNGQGVDIWEGYLPRLLFFFALDRPVITRSEICDAFWPELDTDQAVNVFHVTKRRLHKALDMDVLVHDDGYYRINPALDVDYDVMRFVGKLMQGRDKATTNPLAVWESALSLYRGPFLQGHNDPWIEERRADFRAGYIEVLHAIAQSKLAENQPEHALVLYERALDADPTREDMHRQAMRIMKQLGRRSEAVAHFRQLEAMLKPQKRHVDSETRAVFDEILT